MSAEEPAPEPEAAPQAGTAPEPNYYLAPWTGETQLCTCSVCGWNSFSEGKTIAHVEAVHGVPPLRGPDVPVEPPPPTGDLEERVTALEVQVARLLQFMAGVKGA